MSAITTSASFDRPPSAPRRWPGVLLALAVVLLVYGLVAVHGVRQENAAERVLPWLSPVFDTIREQGGVLIEQMMQRGTILGIVVTAAALLVALLAMLRGGRRAAPLLLAAVAVSAATWGQVLLFQARTWEGIVCYALGILGAIGLGLWYPLRSVPGFGPFPPPEAPPVAPAWQPPWWQECVLIAALGIVCVVSRAWALTELSDFLDLENISVMVQSRTVYGYLSYLHFGFVENNGGAAHPPLQEILFRIFGTGIFMLRMAAVLWSTAGALLMYWFVRRLGGVLPAVIAASFFIAAPDQLFWGRSENTHFAPTAVLVLVTLHLALWMLRRFSFWSVLALALWTPFSRFFYSAGIVLVVYPIALVLHALLFVRGTWRKVWYVLPIILLGIGLWTFSLSAMKWAIKPDGGWNFVHPAKLYGGTVWTKQGEFANASLADLVRLQAASMTRNLNSVVHDLTINADGGFSHWYLRSQAGTYKTTQNAGLVVLVALGMGYLLGQFWDRRAFMLLVLVGLAVLPGILSADPAARRIAAIYPGFNIIAAVLLAVFIRLAWERAGAAIAWLTADVVFVALLLMLFTSMATHYALPTQPVIFGDHVRFAKPLFEDSDAIIHNVDPPAIALVMAFGSLDRILDDPPGFQYVPPGRWLRALLDPRVTFEDEAFTYTMWPQRRAELRETFDPRRITYLMLDTPATHRDVELTRALYPNAQVRDHHSARDDRVMVAFSVDVAEIERRRQPVLWSAPGSPPIAPTGAIEHVTLATGGSAAPATLPPGGALIGGGILVDQPGWYGWSIEPACAGATLSVDGQVVESAAVLPTLPGAHAFEIALPDVAACQLPLRIQRHTYPEGRAQVVESHDLVSPSVASLPAARAQQVLPYDGYGALTSLFQVPGQPAGVGRDANGELSLMVREHGTWRLRRFNPAGQQVFEKEVDFPADRGISSVVVDRDGTVYALTERFVAIYDKQGNRVGTVQNEAIVWESEVALWDTDKLLINFPHRNALAIFNRSGELLQEVTAFSGGPGKFYFPATLTVGPDGLILVRQGDGTALLLRSAVDPFALELVASFDSPSTAHGAAFDGPDRIIVPDEVALRTYDGKGQRLMARDPARDLSSMKVSPPGKILVTPERLLALDQMQNRVSEIAR